MTNDGEQSLQAIERKIDAPGMKGSQPRDDIVDVTHAILSCPLKADTTIPINSILEHRAYRIIRFRGDDARRRSGMRGNRQLLLLGCSWSPGQQPAQFSERRAQFMPMHHHVDHAMLCEILGALETLRQFLADGLLDHAWAGKTDQRARLGYLYIA